MEKELLLLVGGLIGALLVALFWRRGKKLPRRVADEAIMKIRQTEALAPAHAVIEAHKIFVFTLATRIKDAQQKRIRATDVLKKFVKHMPNEAQIWKTHRLRNRIAHEPDMNVSSTHADLARRDLIRAIQSLAKK